MNEKSLTETVFSETTFASKLINDFTGLVRRQKRERLKTVASQAALSFFDKTVLTISEFFEPIGYDLRIPAPVQKNNDTIKDFFKDLFSSKITNKIKLDGTNSRIGLIDNPNIKNPPAMTIKRFFEPL